MGGPRGAAIICGRAVAGAVAAGARLIEGELRTDGALRLQQKARPTAER